MTYAYSNPVFISIVLPLLIVTIDLKEIQRVPKVSENVKMILIGWDMQATGQDIGKSL